MIKRLSAVLISLGMIFGIGLIAAPNASAATGCVNNYEWNHTYVGDIRSELQRFYGTRGWVVGETLSGNQIKKYDHCGSTYTRVRIVYQWDGFHWRVYDATRV